MWQIVSTIERRRRNRTLCLGLFAIVQKLH